MCLWVGPHWAGAAPALSEQTSSCCVCSAHPRCTAASGTCKKGTQRQQQQRWRRQGATVSEGGWHTCRCIVWHCHAAARYPGDGPAAGVQAKWGLVQRVAAQLAAHTVATGTAAPDCRQSMAQALTATAVGSQLPVCTGRLYGGRRPCLQPLQLCLLAQTVL